MIPSFFRKNAHDSSSSSQPKRNDAQTALDGLRGLACLIVAFYHYFGYSYEVNFGYVYNEEEPNGGWMASRWNLPIIKLVLSGPNMVAIFFVISGYVLTHRFLTLVHQGKADNAVMSMSSAIFRRFIRLYAPVFAATLLLQVFLQIGIFEHGRSRWDGRPYPPRGESGLAEQFWLFWGWWREACNPFSWDRHYPDQFDGNIWTIPIEYRCSMVVFLVAIGLARVRTKLRLFFIVVVMGWALNVVLWEVVLFLMGMLLAQVDVLLAAKKENLVNLEKIEGPSKSDKQWMWYPTMLVAIYLCSIPWHRDGAFGWQVLNALDPFPGGFIFSTWQCVGATIMVICALYWERYQTFLNWEPIQYLGHVSYALYLVHGSLIKLATYSLKWDIFEFLKERFHPEDESGIVSISVWVSFIFFFIPALIVVSDMFDRAVDKPIVVWSRKIWEYCTA
jgi:peptidoglycan/LPS O-acetylase OafA/YrhL